MKLATKEACNFDEEQEINDVQEMIDNNLGGHMQHKGPVESFCNGAEAGTGDGAEPRRSRRDTREICAEQGFRISTILSTSKDGDMEGASVECDEGPSHPTLLGSQERLAMRDMHLSADPYAVAEADVSGIHKGLSDGWDEQQFSSWVNHRRSSERMMMEDGFGGSDHVRVSLLSVKAVTRGCNLAYSYYNEESGDEEVYRFMM
jgi:hypothetical protein